MSQLTMDSLSPEEQKAIRDALDRLDPYLAMSKVMFTETSDVRDIASNGT